MSGSAPSVVNAVVSVCLFVLSFALIMFSSGVEDSGVGRVMVFLSGVFFGSSILAGFDYLSDVYKYQKRQ